MPFAGGIDVGGTKIEAKLFARDWRVIESRRMPAPRDSYENLLDAIEEQYRWLDTKAGDSDIAVGVGVPGLVDQKTGHMVVANLPVKGRNLRDDLVERVQHPVPFVNDCRAFTLSEAMLGAGRGYDVVLGLVLGTGVAGGLAIRGDLIHGKNGAAGEFGHTPIPGTLMVKHGLPLLQCGCGQIGCYETLISGPGMVRLADALFSLKTTPAEVARFAANGDETLCKVMDIWTEITGAMIRSIMLVTDPDCIVLGGGLSNIAGINDRLAAELPNGLLNGMQVPPIRLAEGGDSSGARGAAMVALGEYDGGHHG